MIVFSNHRLGPASELLVSAAVAESMLRDTAEAASLSAEDRWERELVRWLEDRASMVAASVRLTDVAEARRVRPANTAIDVGEVAWSPEHFERQRRFLIDGIEIAGTHSLHVRALGRWAAMIQAHPRGSVQVGRRWSVLVTI
ncbi:MAG: hypothetical protein H0V17_35105 [Deltaproteobacteria bacterium]|nr:hypothetical protein [Deltaproteobacteria bacterium]